MSTPLDSPRGSNSPPETALFSATLHPHRSLSRTGIYIVLGFVAALSVISAVPFIVMGAWPIGGFFGLDFALLYLCFRINNARARAYEEVLLSRIELIIRKVSWRGRMLERRFNPFWVRLKTVEDDDYGMIHLAVVQRAEEIEVGACLAPVERADFAHAFGRALAEVRR